jgi:hypothetical protein
MYQAVVTCVKTTRRRIHPVRVAARLIQLAGPAWKTIVVT